MKQEQKFISCSFNCVCVCAHAIAWAYLQYLLISLMHTKTNCSGISLSVDWNLLYSWNIIWYCDSSVSNYRIFTWQIAINFVQGHIYDIFIVFALFSRIWYVDYSERFILSLFLDIHIYNTGNVMCQPWLIADIRWQVPCPSTD